MKRLSALLCLLFSSAFAFAEESEVENAFGYPFRDNAVLQRDCDLPVWGTATPGSRVVVFIDGDIFQTAAGADGNWKLTIPPQAAGAGHRMTLVVEGLPVKTLSDIAFGDVWLFAGAEEMEAGFFHNLVNGNEELQDAEYPAIRLFLPPRHIHAEPMGSVAEGFWQPCDGDHIRGYSALAFFFGRNLHKRLGVPVGLVCANWGGTPTAAWLPVDAALQVPALAEDARKRRDAIHAWTHGGEASFLATQVSWDASYDGSDPYENADILPGDEDFVEDARWVATEVPSPFEEALGSPQFNGIVWYRKTVFLSAEQAAKNGTLCLDKVDDEDVTWFNGAKIGECRDYNAVRRYAIPKGAMRAGANLIAIRVKDVNDLGGLHGNAENIAIRFDDGTSVDLTKGLWSCRANKAPKGPRPEDPMKNPGEIGACYNGLVHPFAGMAVRGIVWADGIVEAEHPGRYPETIAALVRDWRARFPAQGGGKTPFYLYQMSSHREQHRVPFESPLASIRWAQTRLAQSEEGVYVATTLDDGNPWLVHSANKRLQGDRIAALALAHTYGAEGPSPDSPLPDSAAYRDGKVFVSFRRADALATSDSKNPAGFQLAGADGVFAWAAATDIQGATVVLGLPEDMDAPATVRYAWDDFALPAANLTGANGHPVGSFEIPVGN